MMLGALPLQVTCATDTSKNLLEACKLDTDFLRGSLIYIDLLTGGLTPLVFWGMVTALVYVRYRNGGLTLMVATPVMGVFWALLPSEAVPYAAIMIGLVLATTLYFMISRLRHN